METQTDINPSRESYTDMPCFAAIVSLLIGLGSFGFFLIILLLEWDSRSQIFEFGFSSLYPIILLSVFLAAPFFGLLAVWNILAHWRFVTSPNDSREDSRIRKTAGRFLVASFLFSVAGLLRIIFGMINERIQGAMSKTLFSMWFIVTALLALSMGLICFRLYVKTSSRILTRIVASFAIICGFVVVGAIPWTTNFGFYFMQRAKHSLTAETFSGNSDALERTVIIPTLDSPCPRDKNIIWCSSFQLAWNRMKDDVIGEPVRVIGAEELAARLNAAEQSGDDMESSSYYAAAGRVKDDIINTVQKDMATQFPSHSVPDFNEINEIKDFPDAILAYSYLTANVPFKYPFRQFKEGFAFTDSQGVETKVGAFGAWGLLYRYKKMREQVEILYLHEDHEATDRDLRMKEFAVDLCRHSQPYQVVVAVVELKDSLAQTLDYTRRKIADFRLTKNYERISSLDDTDVLIVPEMFWAIEHRFTELIGKIVANADPAMPIVEAKQGITFRLDRYGAMLESEATIAVSAIPRYFHFNRPFLVYMKKRGREQPFFMMWVDNAELLNIK